MDDTVFDMFQEIAAAPGEIFDIPEMNDQKFDVEQYINGDTDYWEFSTKLHNTSTLFFFIMNRSIALGMLSVANTGDEILAVLDVIQSDTQSDNQGDAVSYTTGESVTF